MKKLLLSLPPLIGCAWLVSGALRSEESPFVPPAELAQLMPKGSVAYVEAPGLPALLEQGLTHPLVARLLASEIGQALVSQAPMSPEAALALADAWAGEPVLARLARVSAKGLALAIGPQNGRPVFALALRAQDPAHLSETLSLGLAKLAGRLSLPVASLVEPHERLRGVDLWHLGEDLTLGVCGELFLASNDKGRLREMLDLGCASADHGGVNDSLAFRESFRAEAPPQASEALVWSWIDLAAIEAQWPNSLAGLRAMPQKPSVHFLLGPAIAALGSASRAGVALALADDGLALHIEGRGIEAGPAEALLYPTGGRPPSLPPALEGEAARALLYRDLGGLFGVRTELFPAEVLPKFSEAISNLAFFFGGGDFSEELLPSLSPWLGVVVREASFRSGATPDVPLPSAVLVARLENPRRAGERLTASFQSLVGFLNIDGAQKGRPPMLLDILQEQGVTISTARFLTPAEDEGVDLRYNLEPACALVGDTFLLGTHVSLVRAMVREWLQDGAHVEPPAGERLWLAGEALAQALEKNHEALVMNAVLKEGKSLEKARGDIDGLTMLAALVESLEVTTSRPGANTLRLDLALELTPEEKP